MMHKAWSSIEEVPYCFLRSSVKFQGHTALKIVEFDPNWAFPDCNSSLNSPMAMKCCTKLETGKEKCPIVFQGNPSNFKVTRDKKSPILTQIGRFRTIGRSQLSNPSDLPCLRTKNMAYLHYTLFQYTKCSLVLASQITSLAIACSIVYWDTYQRIKALRHWPLWREFSCDSWIPRTKGQWRPKCFHLITSSCIARRWHVLKMFLYANLLPCLAFNIGSVCVVVVVVGVGRGGGGGGGGGYVSLTTGWFDGSISVVHITTCLKLVLTVDQ